MRKVRIMPEIWINPKEGSQQTAELNVYDDDEALALYNYFTEHGIPCELISTKELIERNEPAQKIWGDSRPLQLRG